MKKESKKALRRLTFVNFFDRTCNGVLMHTFPLSKDAEGQMARYYEALSYADSEIEKERKTLRKLRRLVLSKDVKEEDALIMLGTLESMQKVRHTTMQNIIAGTKVR